MLPASQLQGIDYRESATALSFISICSILKGDLFYKIQLKYQPDGSLKKKKTNNNKIPHTHLTRIIIFFSCFPFLRPCKGKGGRGTEQEGKGQGSPNHLLEPPSTVGSLLKSRDDFKRVKLYTTGKTAKTLTSHWYKNQIHKTSKYCVTSKELWQKGCRSRKSCKLPNIKAWKVIDLRSYFLTSQSVPDFRNRGLLHRAHPPRLRPGLQTTVSLPPPLLLAFSTFTVQARRWDRQQSTCCL